MSAPPTDEPLGELGVALAAVAAALNRLPAPAMVIGGIAVIARGVPRTTRDIDVAVAAGAIGAAELLAVFEAAGFEPRTADAVAFAERAQVLLIRHAATSIEVDVSLGWLSFELEAIAAAERLSFGGVELPVARAEDLLVYKAVAWRPQDREDIERLLLLHRGEIDLQRVRRIVAELADALEDPARVGELARLIERTQ